MIKKVKQSLIPKGKNKRPLFARLRESMLKNANLHPKECFHNGGTLEHNNVGSNDTNKGE